MKLSSVDKIPPYTTWIFLDKNQRMADDQSIAGRRRIYYDSARNEALIWSESDEQIAQPEEEKHVFTEAEDQLYGNNRIYIGQLRCFLMHIDVELENACWLAHILEGLSSRLFFNTMFSSPILHVRCGTRAACSMWPPRRRWRWFNLILCQARDT
ncbi:enhancer of zeste 1 [Hordeum vulgare]|nr:enhancer of zeste 1 [Hordeum vulgare]